MKKLLFTFFLTHFKKLFVIKKEAPKPDNWVRGKMVNLKKEDKKKETIIFPENDRNALNHENQRNLISRINEKSFKYLNI